MTTITAYLEVTRNGANIELEVRGEYEPGQKETRDEPGFDSSVGYYGIDAFAWNEKKNKYCIPFQITEAEAKEAQEALEVALMDYEEEQAEESAMSPEDR